MEERERVPFGDVLAQRAADRERRKLPLPQEFDSLETYHEAKRAVGREPLQREANLDYRHLKGRR